jgi:hypothetical protein
MEDGLLGFYSGGILGEWNDGIMEFPLFPP